MILDSSAIVAVLRNEPEARHFAEIIERSDVVRVSGASVLECSIVLGRDRDYLLDSILETTSAKIEPITAPQVQLARAAHRKFGRGTGHPARLNFGDCLVYALAKDRNEPLLFKGSDFVHTDIASAS